MFGFLDLGAVVQDELAEGAHRRPAVRAERVVAPLAELDDLRGRLLRLEQGNCRMTLEATPETFHSVKQQMTNKNITAHEPLKNNPIYKIQGSLGYGTYYHSSLDRPVHEDGAQERPAEEHAAEAVLAQSI